MVYLQDRHIYNGELIATYSLVSGVIQMTWSDCEWQQNFQWHGALCCRFATAEVF